LASRRLRRDKLPNQENPTFFEILASFIESNFGQLRITQTARGGGHRLQLREIPICVGLSSLSELTIQEIYSGRFDLSRFAKKWGRLTSWVSAMCRSSRDRQGLSVTFCLEPFKRRQMECRFKTLPSICLLVCALAIDAI
jgi:hypothetical protein